MSDSCTVHSWPQGVWQFQSEPYMPRYWPEILWSELYIGAIETINAMGLRRDRSFSCSKIYSLPLRMKTPLNTQQWWWYDMIDSSEPLKPGTPLPDTEANTSSMPDIADSRTPEERRTLWFGWGLWAWTQQSRAFFPSLINHFESANNQKTYLTWVHQSGSIWFALVRTLESDMSIILTRQIRLTRYFWSILFF